MRTYGTVTHILYVEDDPAAAKATCATLEAKGYTVSWGADSIAGLGIILRSHIDLVLLDLSMPGIDGIQFLRIIRELDVPVTVLVMSAHGTLENAEAVAGLGIIKFLVKPVRMNVLHREVAAAIPKTSQPYPLLSDVAIDQFDQLPISHPDDWIEGSAEFAETPADLPAENQDLESLPARIAKAERDLMYSRLDAREAKESLVVSTRALLEILEHRPTFEGSRSARVADYALQLAERMRLPEDTKHQLEIAALLHDIGKITLPEEILVKDPSSLTEEERPLFEHHSESGQAILEHMVAGDRVAQIVRSHHEHFDGTGFPDRLAGAETLVEARVIAVADFLEASLSAAGPDSGQMSAARDALRRGSGSEFDPVIADHASALLDEIGDFRQAHRAEDVNVATLTGGETLARDVISDSGIMYLQQGTVLTERSAARLQQLAKSGDGKSSVAIYVPNVGRVGE